MLLLCTIVLAFAGHVHPEDITIKFHARIGIADDNCSVVDSQEEFSRDLVPLGESLVWRELQDLDWMPIWILEVERRNSRGILVPIGQSLRPRRVVLIFVLP